MSGHDDVWVFKQGFWFLISTDSAIFRSATSLHTTTEQHWPEPLEPLYQPKARYKNRPDSKLGSVRLEIAARLKAHFSA